jgi:hypothetical protein
LTTQFGALAAVLDGVEQGGESLASLSKRNATLGRAVAKLAPLFDAARETAIDDAAKPDAGVGLAC